MSRQLTWRKKYELGVKEIDFQHHYFVELINRLNSDLREQPDPSQRGYLIAELNAYARFHFLSEENLMRKARYPGLEQHRKHHYELIDSLDSRGGLLQVDYTPHKVDRVIEFLFDWFLHHTLNEDRLFADFLSAQRRQG